MSLATTGYDVYNLTKIQWQSGRMHFIEGAALTLASAKESLSGWKDFGAITATDISPSSTPTDHKYCRLGVSGTDKKSITDAKLEFGVKCEESSTFVLALALMGSAAVDRTQTVRTTAAGTAHSFTAAAPSSGSDDWYQLAVGGTHIYALTAVTFACAQSAAIALASATGIYTLAGHGWLANTPVQCTAGTLTTTGLVDKYLYYIEPIDANTFYVSLTAGGAHITGSATTPSDIKFTQLCGFTTTVFPNLVQAAGACFIVSDSIAVDAGLGLVRFLYPVTAVCTPTISAPAINRYTNPTLLFAGITPLAATSRTGYARLILDDATNGTVGVYEFQGQITTKAVSSLDGQKASQYDFTLTVLADHGTFYVRPA